MSASEIEIASHATPVIETILQSGIDPDLCVVFGSGVMALHDIRPSHDVDLVVQPKLFDEMLGLGQTPGEIPLETVPTSLGQRRMVSTHQTAEGQLPIDISTYSLLGSDRRFRRFRERTQNYSVGEEVLKCVSLSDLMARKSQLARSRHPKKERHWIDTCLIDGYLQRPGSSATT